MKRMVTVLILMIIVSCNKKEYGENEIGIQTKGGLPFIELEINGNKADFLVDTGANMSYINYDKIGDLGVIVNSNEPNVDLTGIGGQGGKTFGLYKFRISKNDTIDLPNNVAFRTTNLSNIGIKIDGIIGSDYLRRNNAVIDYKRKVVAIGK